MQRIRVKASSRRIPALSVVPLVRPDTDDLSAGIAHLNALVDAGSVAALAFAAIHYDGTITTGYVKGGRTMQLIGCMRRLEQRLLDAFNADSE